ncbi:MAG: sel1 repeat family protein, partial [Acidobacteria bacterium]|nr:sel1 repeat family protein [Acidobacteriota bacterium]
DISAQLIAAAATGNPCAQYMVGLMLLNGTGLDQSDEKAALWIQKAAEQGLPRAQNDLATLYAEGRGLRRDLQQALFWLRRAADQGLSVARENLKRLGEHSIPPPTLDSSATSPFAH